MKQISVCRTVTLGLRGSGSRNRQTCWARQPWTAKGPKPPQGVENDSEEYHPNSGLERASHLYEKRLRKKSACVVITWLTNWADLKLALAGPWWGPQCSVVWPAGLLGRTHIAASEPQGWTEAPARPALMEGWDREKNGTQTPHLGWAGKLKFQNM